MSLFVVCSVTFALGAIDTEIENKNCDIAIDISSQLVKATYKITLEHRGKKPVSSYTFMLPKDECDKLSFISIRDSAKKDLKLSLSKVAGGCEVNIQKYTINQRKKVFTNFLLCLISYEFNSGLLR